MQYRNVGTNIDCSATSADEGRFRLELSVEQSSVYSAVEERIRAASPDVEVKPLSALGDRPVFRTFKTTSPLSSVTASRPSTRPPPTR